MENQTMYRKTAKKLLKFIEKSPTAFQAVTEMTKRLDKEGFEELKEEDHWKLCLLYTSDAADEL